MAGITGTSQIDDAVRKYLAGSRYTMQERPGVVRTSLRTEPLPKNQGPTVNIPKFGQVTTYALTEGVDMAQAQQITDTNMTITPAEFGAQVILSDMMLDQSRDDFFRVAGRILGESYERQQQQTLCDDFSNYSGTLGGAGTSATLGHIMAGHSTVKGAPQAAGTAGRGGEPGPDPVAFIAPPATLHSLAKTLTGGVGAAGNTQITPNLEYAGYQLAAVPGLTVKSCIDITKDASDDAVCGLFSREAQIFVPFGNGPDAERERDASLRAWEVNFVGRWARGEYNDSWGLAATFDAAPASS